MYRSRLWGRNRSGGKHDHLEFIFTDGSRAVYTDPRRFGIIDLFPCEAEAEHKLLASLGPEPFDPWDAQALADRLKGRKVAIKLALLDQKVVVGVGNIYVCESLHRAGISPRREAGGLVRKNGQPTARLVELVGHVKDVIEEAIQAGGSTLNDFASVDGTLGYFAHHFAVYGREDKPCEKAGCGGVVRRIVQSNRSTFFCQPVSGDQRFSSTLAAKPHSTRAVSRWMKAARSFKRSSQGCRSRPRPPRGTRGRRWSCRADQRRFSKANSCRAEGPGRAQPRGTTRFLD